MILRFVNYNAKIEHLVNFKKLKLMFFYKEVH